MHQVREPQRQAVDDDDSVRGCGGFERFDKFQGRLHGAESGPAVEAVALDALGHLLIRRLGGGDENPVRGHVPGQFKGPTTLARPRTADYQDRFHALAAVSPLL